MATNAEIVEMVEEYLEQCVTDTPLTLEFTAQEMADFHDVEVWEISSALQMYRTIVGGGTSSTADYSIGCYERGPHSRWFIFTWPNMTPSQREMAGGIFLAHEILSTLYEDVKPMLRNVVTQSIPAIRANRIDRMMIRPWIAKLDGHEAILQRYRRDVAGVRPVALRSVSRGLDSLVVSYINRIDALRNVLAGL